MLLNWKTDLLPTCNRDVVLRCQVGERGAREKTLLKPEHWL